jgi:DNA polymerase-3 subunit epsilon
VSFGGIGLRTAALASGKFDISFSHLIFDPGKRSHPKAEQVHGYSDWTLRFQDPFSLYAEEIFSFLSSYELLVAHNAEFDFEFLDREMMLVGLPSFPQSIYCTMQGYRQLGLGGSASLNAVCKRINLARSGSLHGAIEDAWLAMQVFLWLHSCPIRADLPVSMRQPPSNLRDVPPVLQRVPARKRLLHASIS